MISYQAEKMVMKHGVVKEEFNLVVVKNKELQ
jgi:hypothetical protein